MEVGKAIEGFVSDGSQNPNLNRILPTIVCGAAKSQDSIRTASLARSPRRLRFPLIGHAPEIDQRRC